MQNSILVPTDRGMRVIEVHSIIRVQSISNYSKLFFQNGKTLVVAKVLRWFEERLQEHKFIRIHRTHLVNSSCLKAFNALEIELTNGEKFTVARRKRSAFLQSAGFQNTTGSNNTLIGTNAGVAGKRN